MCYRLILLVFCHHRAKTSCPRSPKRWSWTGVNCWGRKERPSPPWSESSPSLPVRSGQRSETLTLVRAGAVPPSRSSFVSHSAGLLPCLHTASLWLLVEFCSLDWLQVIWIHLNGKMVGSCGENCGDNALETRAFIVRLEKKGKCLITQTVVMFSPLTLLWD